MWKTSKKRFLTKANRIVKQIQVGDGLSNSEILSLLATLGREAMAGEVLSSLIQEI